ncbi:hypothetical protein EPUS_04103 [Endocarpon pusillum Z07020]|uniref:Zn(2)-C6 fungal-type domain-containing protein n=1 Tax=Endocarpon pusillum (strain Z07020 / HMAS-L-300199) TaxID=1263415 RepID=U1HSG1_ENDPU|nr:uncharacterized protein EPUS_04103 [Endocarpon pusillum Z07020]ERF73480.1 hypothetical protein EPUS_04103 [Endocarpon pusillum Z07020]
MAKGESIEALLSPQLRVSRPVAACSRCKSAKIRCDGTLPACTACERAGKADSCSGANDEFAKGKERSYVAALEATLEKLQRRVAETKTLQATDPSRRDAVAASHMLDPGHTFPARRIASSGRVHRKEASDVDNLVGDFGFLSVNATSRDFHGFTATTSFARLLLAVSQTGDPGHADPETLPARHLITPIIHHYLDKMFVLMPFFSETDFIASVSAVYADAGRRAKPMDKWMVRMVLAIVAADRSRDKGDGYWRTAQEHVSVALEYADEVLHPGSVAGIQAILLLVQYSMLDPDMFSCWHLIGFASRVMVDLGLHNEPAAEIRMSKDEIEMRRRVFYCVYTLDRSISMAFDRAFSFTDDSASVNLPVVAGSTGLPEPSVNETPQLFLRSLQPSSYLFNIRRIQSSLYQGTRMSKRLEWPSAASSEYTKCVLNDIRSWASSIPKTLSTNHTFLFHLESLYSQIIALAPSCRNPSIPELSKILIFEYAIQYTDLLHPITREHKREHNWHSLFTLIDIHRTNFIGRHFLDVLSTSFDSILSGIKPRETTQSSPEANDSDLDTSPSPSSDVSHSASPLENSARAISCLAKIIDILAYAERRFGGTYGFPRRFFERESAELTDQLKLKQQELGTVQYITGGPPGPSEPRVPPQPQQLQAQAEPQEINPMLHPIGMEPVVPFPPGPAVRAGAHDSDIGAARASYHLPQVPPLLSVPGPQPRYLTFQQALPLETRVEESPSGWFLSNGSPGNYGPLGPYTVYVPPANQPGNFLPPPPETNLLPTDYQGPWTGNTSMSTGGQGSEPGQSIGSSQCGG